MLLVQSFESVDTNMSSYRHILEEWGERGKKDGDREGGKRESGKLGRKTHTHTFNGPFSRTTWVSRYQKGETNLNFTEARGSEWQLHQLGHMQVCTSLQIDNHASTPPLSFLQARCPSCRPTNSVSALKATNGEGESVRKPS